MTDAGPGGLERFDLVIGIGHPDRGDDGVGPFVAEQLAATGVRAQALHGDCARLLDLWAGAESVALVDAARLDAPPGTLICLDAHQDPLPASAFRSSSHLMGPVEAIALARTLDRLPRHLTLFAIAATDTTLGAGLSPPVAATAEALVRRLRC